MNRVYKNIYAFAEFSHWEKVISYLIVDRTKAFLIDTGMGYESIYNEIKAITLCPITVLLTHSHWDHIGGIGNFDDVWVYDNEFEKNKLETGFVSSDIPELTFSKFYSDGFFPKKFSVSGKNNIHIFNNHTKIFSDTFIIDCFNTPGHTPGSSCFYIEKYAALFTGDTLYPGPLYAFLPESNWRKYVGSVVNLKFYLPNVDHVFPGHNSIHESNFFLRDIINNFENIPALVNRNTKELKFNSFSFILH